MEHRRGKALARYRWPPVATGRCRHCTDGRWHLTRGLGRNCRGALPRAFRLSANVSPREASWDVAAQGPTSQGKGT